MRHVVLALILATTPAFAADEPFRITILHTSDLHGRVLPHDFARDVAVGGSLARVAAAVEAVRAASDGPVLVLDSGDTIQGSAFEAVLNIELGGPSPTIEAMNAIGYDAMAVGNHEFNYGLGVLRRAEAEATFPFLAANAVAESTGDPAFTPFVVRNLGGVTVGILGLVTPNIPNWEEPAHYHRLRFEPMADAAARWVPHLRDDLGCDLVIVLAHAGFGRDLDDESAHPGGGENQSWAVAQVSGVDLLLTGHTHHDIPPHLIGRVIASQPMHRGRRLTRVDLELEPSAAGWTIASWSGKNLDLEASAPSAELLEQFSARAEDVGARLARPLTTATAAVAIDECRGRDCAAVDLIHAVQLAASGADVSLASLLSGGTPDLDAGPVSRRWVEALYVYPNTLRAVRLTGAQLKDVLEHAARAYDGLRCDRDACEILFDPDIPGYNLDTAQGVSYGIDPTRPEGDRIVGLRFRGEPLAPEQELHVVCNNYRAAGGGGFPHLNEAPVVWRSSAEVARLIADHLAAQEEWRPRTDQNWFVVAPLR